MTLSDLVLDLLGAHPEIVYLYFRGYRPRPGFAARLAAGDPDTCGASSTPDLWSRHYLRGQVVSLLLDGAAHLLPEDGVCALSSIVETASDTRHLLLLDFACPVSAENQARLVRTIRRLEWTGCLLISGSSYHFLGDDLLSLEDWTTAMGLALLIDGIDQRYIGHAIASRRGALRLTTCPMKPTEPTLCEVVR